MNRDRLVIAVDGPAGSGKSTIAKKIADILKIEYIDTGAMYRALTLKIIESKLDFKDTHSVLSLLENTTISFKDNHIYLDDVIVDKEIRKNIINKHVSDIAKIKEVREEMVKKQQRLAQNNSVIMDGRDVGTIILPDANFKFFIVASVEERARRRHKDLIKENEEKISYEQVLYDIIRRDEIDSTREVSPLLKSPDSYEIDTSNKTIEQTIEEILNIVKGDK